MKAWLSTMPVDGDSSAASQFSAGSSARASAPLRVCRSSTPLASAWALIDCSFCGLVGGGRDDQLAAVAMRDAVVAAVSVERVLAAHAHPRHQAAGRIVDAGMDHLAVARRRHGADAFRGLQHDDLAAGLRQPPRHGKADHAGADDDAINSVHSRSGSRIV